MPGASLIVGGLAVGLHGSSVVPDPSGAPSDGLASGSFISAAEPLLPGERLTATWSAPAPRAVLAVRVADPLRGSRPLAFGLPTSARSASLTVDSAGTVTFQSGTLSRTISVPPLSLGDPGGPSVPWDARSPRVAVQRFIDHLDLNGADDLAWLCAAIEPAARAAYGDPATLQRLAGGAPPVVVDLPRQRALSCPLLELSLFGGGNVPKVIGSAGTARTVRRIAPSQAIVVAALTHHFLPSSSVPHGGRVHAMVPVLTMRDSVGRWYVSTPGQLLPLAAFDDPAQIERPRDIVAYLHRRRAALLQRERASVSGLAHELAGLRADTVPIETSPACAGARSSGLSDPAGDVTVDGTGDQDLRPRDPQLITVDIRSATLAIAQTRLCLELTFTGPAPSTAEVELSLTQPHRVRTINGPSVLPVGPTVTFDLNAGDAVAEQQTGGPDRVPMRGVTANRDQQSISLSVPLNELNGIKPSKRFAWSVAALGPDPYAEGFSDKVPNGLHEPTL